MSTIGSYNFNSLATWEDYSILHKEAGNVGKENFVNCINRASTMIESYIGRKIKARKYWREVYRNVKEVCLSNRPLLAVDGIYDGFDLETGTGTATTSGSTTSLTDTARTEDNDFWNGADIEVQVVSGAPEISVVKDYNSTGDVFTLESYAPLSEAVATSDAYTLRLRKVSSYYTLNIETDVIDIDNARGLIRLNGEYPVLVIDYVAGYQQIPDDIKMAALMQARHLMQMASSAGATSGQIGSANLSKDRRNFYTHLVPEVADMLNHYRRLMRKLV